LNVPIDQMPADAPLLRVFRNRDYLRYTLGNGISLIGLWVQRLAIGWLTWQLTHSGFWLGAVAFADLFPALVIGPFAGVLADRFDRARILTVTQSISLTQAAALWLIYETGHASIYVVFALTLGLGINAAITQPARLALIPQLVRAEDLNTALALNSVLFNSARFVGPVVAGLIISVSNLGMTFLFNAVSYLAMIVALLALRPMARPRSMERRSVREDLVDGVRYSVRHRTIGPLLLLSAAVALFARPIADLLPGFAGAVFGRGATGLVWMTSAMGAGSIIGGLWLAQRGPVSGLPLVALAASVLAGACLIGFSLTNSFGLALPLLLVASSGMAVCGTATQTLVQRIVADDKRGRVMSIWGLIFRGAPSLGVLTMGALSERFGLAMPVLGAAVLCVAFGVYAHRWRARLDGEVALHERPRPA
jgi:MFS family permease